jgi:hypothetical protein
LHSSIELIEFFFASAINRFRPAMPPPHGKTPMFDVA